MTSNLVTIPIVAVLAALMIAGSIATLLRADVTVDRDDYAEVLHLHRRATGWRFLGLIAAVVTTLALTVGGLGANLFGPGLAAAVAPAASAIVFLLAICLSELTIRRSETPTRTAQVTARRVRDLLPRGPLALALLALALLGSVLVGGVMLGSADDLGRAGRSLSATCTDAAGTVTGNQSHGPWPGSYYAIPIAVAALIAIALSAITLAVISRRPSPGTESTSLDLVLRQWSGRDVLHALALAAFATMSPVLALMALAAGHMECGPGWFGTLATGAAIASALSAGAALGLFTLLMIGPTLRVPPEASPQVRR